jgi:protein phosphatase
MKIGSARLLYDTSFEAFQAVLSLDPVLAASGEAHLSLPRFPSRIVKRICTDATSLFASEPILLRISSPLVVVGDIHGHLLDLVRIFQHCGLPPATRYLFLGDMIDRGGFSLETILLLYLLKLRFPRDFYLIRGNHEFLASTGGHEFERELKYLEDESAVYSAFLGSFEQIPLAAIVDGQTICVHGGIGPTLVSPGQVAAIQRPIDDFSSELIKGLLWSDPSESIQEFAESPRGVGSQFGQGALFRFLRASGLLKLVRGHECISEGIRSVFDGRLTTVFSASNYCGVSRNKGAVLWIRGVEFEALVFPPLNFLPRAQATFFDIPDERRHGVRDYMPVVKELPLLPDFDRIRRTSETPPRGTACSFDVTRWKERRRLS